MAHVFVNPGDSVAVLASAARVATPTVDQFELSGSATGLIVVIDVTAATGSPSVVFTIQGYDLTSTKKWTVLASAAITGTGTTVLRVSPHITASANLIAKDIVPSVFTVAAVHTGGDSITYSVAAQVA